MALTILTADKLADVASDTISELADCVRDYARLTRQSPPELHSGAPGYLSGDVVVLDESAPLSDLHSSTEAYRNKLCEAIELAVNYGLEIYKGNRALINSILRAMESTGAAPTDSASTFEHRGQTWDCRHIVHPTSAWKKDVDGATTWGECLELKVKELGRWASECRDFHQIVWNAHMESLSAQRSIHLAVRERRRKVAGAPTEGARPAGPPDAPADAARTQAELDQDRSQPTARQPDGNGPPFPDAGLLEGYSHGGPIPKGSSIQPIAQFIVNVIWDLESERELSSRRLAKHVTKRLKAVYESGEPSWVHSFLHGVEKGGRRVYSSVTDVRVSHTTIDVIKDRHAAGDYNTDPTG